MVLEATLICLDNSEWMRNGDYTPSRLEAQNDAVQFVCGAKLQSNPQSSVGVMTYASQRPEVLVNLTADIGKILTSIHGIKLGGQVRFSDGLQIAQLALKHRQNKDQKQRIIAFVGSPIEEEEKALVNLAKKLKKNNVAVDLVNFGEVENTTKLEAFIAAINSNDNSHLVTIPPGPHILSDILVSSPIISEEGGAGVGGGVGGGGGFEFGIDPNTDPELALALRISMEEERQRQERLQAAANATNPAALSDQPPAPKSDSDIVMHEAKTKEQLEEEAILEQALAMSMTEAMDEEDNRPVSELTEEEQLERALALSTQMVEEKENNQLTDILQQDPNFMSSVLGSLPGVDPNDPRIKSLLGGFSEGDKQGENEDEKKKDKEEEKKE